MFCYSFDSQVLLYCQHMFDLPLLIKSVGYVGLAGITFAESGLLIGFFLPGDSLLFTAGFIASQGILDIKILVPLLFVAAVLGDSVGYSFGYRVGPKIFKKTDSLFFDREHIARAETFFEKYGAKTIVIARFLPVVRTFAPIMAGVGRMRYRTFLAYNIFGALLWAVGLLLLGYFLGRVIPDADRYILPIVGLIVLISVLPQTIHFCRDPKLRQQVYTQLRRIFLRS